MSKPSKKTLYRRELYAALALALPISAMAAVTPANNANGPQLIQIGGQAPIVNIVTPNGAGVSHNQFTQLDVGAPDVVLNNAQTATISTLLGPNQTLINDNLKGGAAKLIIAEVIGNSASQLNGALEIAGSKAALIIANPNGITANGASFINASRVTLATGVPKLDAAGNVTSIDVAKGVINVTGKGADFSGVEMADLMARSIVLNAELKADKLRVITGASKVAYAAADSVGAIAATAIAGEGAAPALALDVAALGGMHANAIRMIGTEAGVGVNVAGTISGKTSTDLTSGGIVNIASTGAVKSGGSVNLTTCTHVFNAGTISADSGNIVIASQMPDATATLDSKGGSILAPKGLVSFKGFGHKRTGQLASSNSNLASDDNGNSFGANSSMNDGNGSMAKPPVTEQPTTNPPVTNPPATDPPVTNPPATNPPATNPPATNPPATNPPATNPPATNPPPIEKPVVEQPRPEPAPFWGYPTFGFVPWMPSYGYGAWNRPSYGFASWGYPSFGFAPWMPSFFRPQPVFSPWRPTASYGVRLPRHRW